MLDKVYCKNAQNSMFLYTLVSPNWFWDVSKWYCFSHCSSSSTDLRYSQTILTNLYTDIFFGKPVDLFIKHNISYYKAHVIPNLVDCK